MMADNFVDFFAGWTGIQNIGVRGFTHAGYLFEHDAEADEVFIQFDGGRARKRRKAGALVIPSCAQLG
jgi:hypothetical protein